MKLKQGSVWEKIQQAESAQWTLEEVKTAIHWFRQLTAFLCGVLWGSIPFTGFYGFTSMVVVNSVGTIIFYTTVLKVDPEDFGGHGALTQEALPPAISMFLLTWIVTYSLLQF